MPIYEYLCAACGHELEVIQSVSEPPLKQCPSCKKRTLKKMVSAAGFVLKGTGWYATDFRDKGKPKQEEKKEKAEVASETASKPEEGKQAEAVTSKENKDAEKPVEKTKRKKSADTGS